MNEARKTKECHNILSLAIADLEKKLCDLRNCKANVEEDIIRPSTDFADKEDQLCASITIVPKGIKKGRFIIIKNVGQNHGQKRVYYY